MNRRKSRGSELQKVFIFLGVLLILLVGSFFVGMYLGSEVPQEPTVISEPGETSQIEDTGSAVPQSPVPAESGAEPVTEPLSPESPDVGYAPPEPEDRMPVPDPTAEPPPDRPPSSRSVYSVQVGAFRDPGKAEDRVAQLKKKGYDAYMVPPVGDGKSALHKVRVGHFAKREDADALSRKIRKGEGIQAFVTYR